MKGKIITMLTMLAMLGITTLFCLSLPVRAVTTTVTLSPNVNTNQGSYFEVNITINDVTDMYAWEVWMKYRKIINIVNVTQDETLFNGTLGWKVDTYDYSHYKLYVYGYFTGNVSGVSGSGVVARLNFTAIYNGTTTIDIIKTEIFNSAKEKIDATSSSCNVTIAGTPVQYFLGVTSPEYGSLNLTAGTHVYNNGTDVSIKATEDTGAFQYIKVDSTIYKTSTVTVTMNSDHAVSALFKIPKLTIHTNIPNVNIQLGRVSYTTDSSGNLQLTQPIGVYTLKATKPGYYSVTQSFRLIDDKTIIIQMHEITYYTPGTIIPPSPLLSKKMMFSTDVPWSPSYTENYWVDSGKIIYVEPVPNTTAHVKITVHYATLYFPAVEIEASNVAKIEFDITKLYEVYAKEDFKQVLDNSKFFGIRVDSNRRFPLYIKGFPYKPEELWKTSKDGSSVKLTDWNWIPENNAVLITHFCTISLIFGEGTSPGSWITPWLNIIVVLIFVGFILGMVKKIMG